MLTLSAHRPGWAAAAVARLFGRPGEFRVDARSALLIDFATGEELHSQNPTAALPPASIAKLMTLRFAWGALHGGRIKLTDRVPVSAASCPHPAMDGAFLLFLEPGDYVTVEQLMKGMTIPSASDAVVAMAERLSKGHTRFVDPHGLSEQNQTTAGDLALLARAYLAEVPEALAFLHCHRMFTYRGRNLAGTASLPGGAKPA
jgi:serine-type D-Ala-D-Ala carboxypeptidase (penicillin-binding protein 5/6)